MILPKLAAIILTVLLLNHSISMAPTELAQQGSNQTSIPNQSGSENADGAQANSTREESTSTELPDFTSFKNTSTFTCYGRVTGYYADVKLGCRVYHFCTQMEGIGETSYQRMSYICLEGSIFDQRDLNCVRESDLKVECSKAEAEYESSNKQFDTREESQPSMSDNLAANLMMNPLTRFIAG